MPTFTVEERGKLRGVYPTYHAAMTTFADLYPKKQLYQSQRKLDDDDNSTTFLIVSDEDKIDNKFVIREWTV